MSVPLRVIPLAPQTAAMLARPINGRGGFQSLMRRIQGGLRGQQLTVDQADLDALVRHVRGAHVGGFQRRAREILIDVVMQALRETPAPPRPAGKVVPFRQLPTPTAVQPCLPLDDEAGA